MASEPPRSTHRAGCLCRLATCGRCLRYESLFVGTCRVATSGAATIRLRSPSTVLASSVVPRLTESSTIDAASTADRLEGPGEPAGRHYDDERDQYDEPCAEKNERQQVRQAGDG